MNIGTVVQIEDRKVVDSFETSIRLDMVVVVDTLLVLKQLADLQDACTAIYASQELGCGNRKFVRISGEEAAQRMEQDASLAANTAFFERASRTVHATAELMSDLKRQKQLEPYTFHVIDEGEAKELLRGAVARVLLQEMMQKSDEPTDRTLPKGEVLPRLSEGERALLIRGYLPVLIRATTLRMCYGLLQDLHSQFIDQMRHIEEVRRENAIRAYLDGVQKEQRLRTSAKMNLGGGQFLTAIAGLVSAQQ